MCDNRPRFGWFGCGTTIRHLFRTKILMDVVGVFGLCVKFVIQNPTCNGNFVYTKFFQRNIIAKSNTVFIHPLSIVQNHTLLVNFPVLYIYMRTFKRK